MNCSNKVEGNSLKYQMCNHSEECVPQQIDNVWHQNPVWGTLWGTCNVVPH